MHKKFKYKFIFVSLLIFLSVNIISSADGTDGINITASNISVSIGEDVEVPISVSENSNLAAFSGSVEYDSNVIEPISYEMGDILKDSTHFVNLSYKNNTIKFNFTSSKPIAAAQVLIKLKFKSKPNISAFDTYIKIVDPIGITESGNSVALTPQNGTITFNYPNDLREDDNNGSSVSGKTDKIDKIEPTPSSTEIVINKTDEPKEIDDIVGKFNDVTNHWAIDSINWAVSKGLINGTGNNKFEPDRNITRAEFIKVMINCNKNSEPIKYENLYNDVGQDFWAASEIQSATNMGLIEGYNGYFKPDDPITRQEIIKILILYCNCDIDVPTNTKEISSFSDISLVSDWAKPFMDKALSLGLIKGTTQNELLPVSNASRAEAVQLIYNAFNMGLIKI